MNLNQLTEYAPTTRVSVRAAKILSIAKRLPDGSDTQILVENPDQGAAPVALMAPPDFFNQLPQPGGFIYSIEGGKPQFLPARAFHENYSRSHDRLATSQAELKHRPGNVITKEQMEKELAHQRRIDQEAAARAGKLTAVQAATTTGQLRSEDKASQS